MARVTLPDPRGSGEPVEGPRTYTLNLPFEVPDSDQALLDYYRGEGANIELGVHVVARGSMEFDGEKYVEVVELIETTDGEFVTADDVVPAKSASRADWERAARFFGISDEAIEAAANKGDLIDMVTVAAAEATSTESEPQQ